MTLLRDPQKLEASISHDKTQKQYLQTGVKRGAMTSKRKVKFSEFLDNKMIDMQKKKEFNLLKDLKSKQRTS